MKLYHFAGTWYVPGQQPKGASRRDVPGKPAELAAWLNHRRVPIEMPLQEPSWHGSCEAEPAPIAAPAAPSIAEQSLALDDGFDALPLARQLDLASRAMENARDQLKPRER